MAGHWTLDPRMMVRPHPPQPINLFDKCCLLVQRQNSGLLIR